LPRGERPSREYVFVKKIITHLIGDCINSNDRSCDLLRGESFRDFPNDEIREIDRTSKKRLTGINVRSLKRDDSDWRRTEFIYFVYLNCINIKKYIRNCDNNAHTLMHYKCYK